MHFYLSQFRENGLVMFISDTRALRLASYCNIKKFNMWVLDYSIHLFFNTFYLIKFIISFL